MYLCLAADTKQHGHVGEHADNDEGNRGNALCVQHVWIVPAMGVTQDVALLSTVTTIRRQQASKYTKKLIFFLNY